MAFLCFAFDAILEKKTLRFLLFVFLAVLFHFPALIFLPAYWIAKLKIDKSFPIIMASLFVFVFVFRTYILNLMSQTYGSGEENYSSEVQFFGTKVIFMVLMLAYGFYQFYSHKYNTDVEANCFSALMYFMGIAAVIQTFCFYNNIFERLADYYYQFSVLYVPLILLGKDFNLRKIDKNGSPQTGNALNLPEIVPEETVGNNTFIGINTVVAAVIIVFCIWRFISFTGSGNDHLTPFYFFWQ